MLASSLLGILAVETGWVVTEVGRQPWVIQGVMRTEAGVSPGLTGTEAVLTLASFAVVYVGLLVLYSYVVGRIIRDGPAELDDHGRVGDADEGSQTPPEAPVPEEVPTDD
jgi:cytochrome d ubiquinol oxidase subunit I